jgi:hypothetical protein
MLVAAMAPTMFSQSVIGARPPLSRAAASQQNVRPTCFVENLGQAPKDVLWQAEGAGFEASFSLDSFVLRLFGASPESGHANAIAAGGAAAPPRVSVSGRVSVTEQRISLAGASPQARMEPLDPLPGKLSFFRGNNPKRWATGLATYTRLRYQNVYPGIDLLFYTNQGALEYDFVVSPGADPGAIRLRVEDGHPVRISEDGVLQVGEGAEAVLHRPLLYQNAGSGKQVVSGKFVSLADHTVGFQFSRYDASRALVIDPALSLLYSTYLGGPHDDESTSIAVDAQGNSYILGWAGSTDYPVSANAYQPERALSNAGVLIDNMVVTKMSPSGIPLYSTFLGGSTGETSGGIVVDAAGNAYLTGTTKSLDYPVTSGAYEGTYPSGAANSAVVSELGPDGSSLLYSTFFGGSGGSTSAQAVAIALHLGNLYFVGSAGPGLPTTAGAYLAQINSGQAAFVAALNPAATGAAQLVASTYYGAANPAANSVSTGNGGYSLVLDSSGNPWIAGQTYTNNLPTTANALQPTLPALSTSCQTSGANLNSAAFVAHLSSNLESLLYGSYLSGKTTGAQVNAACSEYAHAVALDASGNVYVAGATASAAFPTTASAIQRSYPGSNNYVGFVSKLSPDGTQMLWSSYLGGNGGYTFPAWLGLDGQGNPWVGGLTQGGTDFPISAVTYQSTQNGTFNGFLTEFSPDGTQTPYSTYIGGSLGDNVLAFGFDAQNNVYVTGNATSRNFPVTPNAFQPQFANGDPVYDGGDIFFLILGTGAIGTVSPTTGGNTGDVTVTIGGAGFSAGSSCALVMGGTTIQASTVAVTSGGTSMTCSFALNGAATGSYQLQITNPGAAPFTASQPFEVTSGGAPTVWANMVGRSQIRTGVPSTFFVSAGNSGNSDAVFTILWLMLDPDLTYTLPNGVQSANGTVSVDFQAADAVTDATTGFQYVGFLIPLLKAGDVVSFPVQITAAANQSVLTLAAYTQPPWFQSRAAALAELSAYGSGNPAQIPGVCRPVQDGAAAVEDCAGMWINEITSAAANADIQDSPISGNGNPANNPSTLQTYIANLVTGLEGSLGVPSANPVNLPVLPTSGIPFIATESAGLYLASIGYGLYTPPPNSSALPAVRQPRLQSLFCNGTIFGFWINTDSTCAGSVLTREWEQQYTGTNILGQACSGTYYAQTSTFFGGCDPWPVPHPQPNLCYSVSPSAAHLRRPMPHDGESCSSSGGSIDPNDKGGPVGDGSSSHYIRGSVPLTYNVAFENEATASLPAAQVVITDQLDPAKVDLTTLTLGSLAFGTNIVTPPANTNNFSTTFNINSSLSVRMQGSLNSGTGLLKWTFTSIDPTTGLPPSDPTVGFLPPDTDGVKGQGAVQFTVMPKSSDTTSTQIANQASVVFDANAPILTPTWLNTIDNTPPTSAVGTLPAEETTVTFPVSWAGSDIGSGISTYSISVSDNSGPFTVWLNQATATTSNYPGQPGHTYAFYSIAKDGAGNFQAGKTVADSTTTVSTQASSTCDFSHNGATNVSDVQVIVNEALGTTPASDDLNGDGRVNVVDIQIEINAALGLGCIAN